MAAHRRSAPHADENMHDTFYDSDRRPPTAPSAPKAVSGIPPDTYDHDLSHARTQSGEAPTHADTNGDERQKRIVQILSRTVMQLAEA